MIRKLHLKALLLAGSCAVAGTSATAQVSGYTFAQSSGTYSTITGGTAVAVSTGTDNVTGFDDAAVTVTLPFSFTINGTAFTTAAMNTNGTVYFGGTAPNGGYSAISGTNGATAIIAAFNSDLRGFTQTTGDLTSGSATVTNVAATSCFYVGETIVGTGIASGTTVIGLTGTTLTLSAPATSAAAAGATLSGLGDMRADVIGTAPNRTFILQWRSYQAYGTPNTALNFQVRLAEGGGTVTNQTVSLVYGTVLGISSGSNVQVGLRGSSNSDYNDRSSSTSWSATTAGTSNSATVAYSNTIVPAPGLTFTFTPASCNAPGSTTASAITASSATLSWTAASPAPASGYQYEVRTSGAAGSGATGLAASGSTAAGVLTANVTGLAANTQYSVYVRSNCGSGNFSVWSAAYTFTTLCNPSTLPFAEDFNTFLPSCWSQATGYLTPTATALTAASSTSWGADQYLNNSANGPAARINLYTTGKRDWIISPSINLGSTAANYVLEFNLGIIAYSSSTSVTNPTGTTLGSDDTVAVVISTDNGATWSRANALRIFTAANTPLAAPTGGQRYFVPVNNVSGLVKIAFYAGEGTVDDAPDNDIFIDSVRMTTCSRPALNLGNDTTLCTGSSLTLNAGTATTYSYTSAAGGTTVLATTPTYTVTTPGTYYAQTSTSTNPGCFSRDTIVVTGAALPVVNLGNDTTLCFTNAGLTLNAGNPGSSYLWSTSATSQTINVNTSGTYSVRVQTAAGCIGRDTIIVTVNPRPVVNLGNDTGICQGRTLTLNAGNAGSSYQWSTNATTQTIAVTTAGIYTVNVTNSFGCVGRDTIVIAVNPVPTVTLGNDTSFCPGNFLVLTATVTSGGGAYTYLWNTGDVTPSILADSAFFAGVYNYSVRVFNNFGCEGRDTVKITVNPRPVVALGNDTTFCAPGSKLLDATTLGGKYLWSTGATTPTITVGGTGTYSVLVTSLFGCFYRDTINIRVNPRPVAGILYAFEDTLNTKRRLFAVYGSQYLTQRRLYFGDSTSVTLTSDTVWHTYAADGAYSAFLVGTDSCGRDTARLTVRIGVLSVGAGASAKGEVLLYPNPAAASVTVEATNAALQQVTVLNALGAVVLQNDHPALTRETLDLSGLASGSYLVRIRLDGGTVVRRLQVVK